MSTSRASILVLVGLAFAGCSGKESGSDNDDGGGPSDEPLNYEPIVDYVNFQFQGRPIIAYIPENPRGIVWLFHGTSGSVAFANKIDTIATTNLLIPEGIGFACSQSFDQGPENTWDRAEPHTDSVDATFMLDLHAYLVDSELPGLAPLEADTPHYTIGFSAGGDMAGYFANVLLAEGHDVRAVAPHSSSGHVLSGVQLPMVFVFPENDDQGVSSLESAEPSREAQGLRTEFWQPPEIVPLPPDWWTRNPTVSLEVSEKTFNEMVRLGLIDEDGMRLVDVEDTEAALTQWEKDAQIASATLRTEETRVGWALHRMNGYHAHEVRDFFLDFL